jgi:hypothetical protein
MYSSRCLFKIAMWIAAARLGADRLLESPEARWP